jgi:hypothetical protein
MLWYHSDRNSDRTMSQGLLLTPFIALEPYTCPILYNVPYTVQRRCVLRCAKTVILKPGTINNRGVPVRTGRLCQQYWCLRTPVYTHWCRFFKRAVKRTAPPGHTSQLSNRSQKKIFEILKLLKQLSTSLKTKSKGISTHLYMFRPSHRWCPVVDGAHIII